MKIYQDTGYINIDGIIKQGLPFNFIVGGRGTGKTYTSLLTVLQSEKKFLFMRRLQAQCDIVSKPEFSPFKPICADTEYHIGTKPVSKNSAGFYHQKWNGEQWECAGNPIGYTCALSTISNMRGFDASDIEILIYDEFIPESHERPLKNEGAAFLNAYETINRNREIKGAPPLQVLCLANANDLGNLVFMELGLIGKVEKMRASGQELSILRDRGACLILLDKSPISDAKKNTALYRLVSERGEFSKMSIDNDFLIDKNRYKSRPIVEYRPIVEIGEIVAYSHKSDRRIYISQHKTGAPVLFGTSAAERLKFKRLYGFLWLEYISGGLDFESAETEILFLKYFE